MTDGEREQFKSGKKFLIALQATVYVNNRPVVTETLHGIIESDLPGQVACAFENREALECLVRMTFARYEQGTWQEASDLQERGAGWR